jgi:hypothetical protein
MLFLKLEFMNTMPSPINVEWEMNGWRGGWLNPIFEGIPINEERG